MKTHPNNIFGELDLILLVLCIFKGPLPVHLQPLDHFLLLEVGQPAGSGGTQYVETKG